MQAAVGTLRKAWHSARGFSPSNASVFTCPVKHRDEAQNHLRVKQVVSLSMRYFRITIPRLGQVCVVSRQQARCSRPSWLRYSSVSHCVYIRYGPPPVAVKLRPGGASARYTGCKMKLNPHLSLVPKALKRRPCTSTRSLLVMDGFASPCLITLNAQCHSNLNVVISVTERLD